MTVAAHVAGARFTRRTPPSSSTSTTSRWGSAPTSERSFAASSRRRSSRARSPSSAPTPTGVAIRSTSSRSSEASIDLIFAPAYGSSKKNATDIRLAIDALELVFTRPEIGTFILLSGDSDFSSLVIKLKEYGKYVIGVGIRESSSDLLVQNCDEYYSYNALAGLVKASDDEPARKYDPWELVTEAVQRMKRNNDVMRSDRLKQVMQEIDSTFDEKNLGISKFSRFCQEAAQRGLLAVTKLENGQLEVDLPSGDAGRRAAPRVRRTAECRCRSGDGAAAAGEERAAASWSSRAWWTRARSRGSRAASAREPPVVAELERPTEHVDGGGSGHRAPVVAPASRASPRSSRRRRPACAGGSRRTTGERLTRAEAFDLVRRTVGDLAPGDEAVRASEVRRRARQLLGRDSESLSDRMFVRILKDAHDEGIIDLRRRGDDFEVARAAEAAPVAEQVAQREQAASPQSHARACSVDARRPRSAWDIAAACCDRAAGRRRAAAGAARRSVSSKPMPRSGSRPQPASDNGATPVGTRAPRGGARSRSQGREKDAGRSPM